VLQVTASLAMVLGAWPAARWLIDGRIQMDGRVRGLVYLLTFSAAVSVVLAAGLLVRDVTKLKHWFFGPGRLWAADAARHFISISGAMLISGLAATAVLLWVRRRITASQGLAVTGQFDAAWNISMNHVTLVLSSLQTYFLPALARTRDSERNARISSVLTIAALAATGVIAALALAKPWALVLFYSSAFRPAAAYLRWTLVGDYLKVAGWILSIPILAAADMKVFLAADLTALGVFLAASAGLGRWMSAAESAGAGFVLMHAAHLAISASYVRGKYGYRPSRLAAAVWVGGLAVVGLVSVFTWGVA
jgi:PST family polysaccharide transporter